VRSDSELEAADVPHTVGRVHDSENRRIGDERLHRTQADDFGEDDLPNTTRKRFNGTRPLSAGEGRGSRRGWGRGGWGRRGGHPIIPGAGVDVECVRARSVALRVEEEHGGCERERDRGGDRVRALAALAYERGRCADRERLRVDDNVAAAARACPPRQPSPDAGLVQAALKESDVHSAAGCGKRVVAGLAQARPERGRLGSGGGARAVCSRLRDADDLAGKRL
jgi:hypothetical protein